MNAPRQPASKSPMDGCSPAAVALTPLRKRVLELIVEANTPLKAYDLLDIMRREHSRAAPPLIYRTLDFLQRHGLVHRLASLNAYVHCHLESHDQTATFLICDQCSSARELADPQVTGALRTLARDEQFRAERFIVEMRGTCRQCQLAPPD